jgi:hypothetical protein
LLAASSQAQWTGPEGSPLPFSTDPEVEDFLRTADIVASKELEGTRNRPLKLTLAKDGVEARAIFRTVDKKRASARVGDVLIRDFHDSYIYECAAYELSRLLDIENVPPCVLRTIDGQKGSAQLWIEEAVTEFQNRYDVDGPTAPERWPRLFDTMHVFDALIDNFDRHPGNILVDSGDRIWFIDHTRSFRLYTSATKLELAAGCNPELTRALAALDKDDLEILKPFVSFRHIDALMRRRDQILEQLFCSDSAQHNEVPDH